MRFSRIGAAHLLTTSTLSVLVTPAPARAEDIAGFFAQRSLKLIVPYAPGGSYDIYARVVADHMPRFLPGRPPMLVSHLPGGGGDWNADALFKEPQDGTSLAIMPRDIAANQMLRPEIVKDHARRFSWIGSISAYAGVLYVFRRIGVRTIDDFRRLPLVIGSWGQTTESFITPTLLNGLAGTRFKIVTGYRGGPMSISPSSATRPTAG